MMSGVEFLGEFGEVLAGALEGVSSYCPRRDLDLSEVALEGRLLVGGNRSSLLEPAERCRRVIYLGADAGPALWLGDHLGAGRVVAVGATGYTRLERDRLRRTQRFLPLSEVALECALRTALWESAGEPTVVSLNLNLLSMSLVPGFSGATNRGVDAERLFEALDHLVGPETVAVQVWGEGDFEPSGRSSVLAAEIVRDIVLTWGRKKE